MCVLGIYCVLNISFLPSGVVVGAGRVVGTDNNELKTKKVQSKYFLAQDKPGTSVLKYFVLEYVYSFHTTVESLLFYFIIIIIIIIIITSVIV